MAPATVMAIDPQLDCYEILGVAPDAEDEAIRAAFFALTERSQPGRFAGSNEEARRRLAELTTAYEILADPQRRRRYDFHRRIHARKATLHGKQRSAQTLTPVTDHVQGSGRRRSEPVARTGLKTLIGLVTVAAVFAALYVYWGLRNPQPSSSLPTPPVAAQTKAATAPSPPEIKARPTAPPAAAAENVVHAPLPAPQTPTAPAQEARPMPTKSAVAKTAQPNRTAGAAPTAVPAEACTDVTSALGLCKSNSTNREK